jgi:hypothetical protein
VVLVRDTYQHLRRIIDLTIIMKLRHTLTSNQILWLTKLLLLLTSVYVKLVETQQCLEKCQCLWVKGKKTADCNGLGLTKLPQVSSSHLLFNNLLLDQTISISILFIFFLHFIFRSQIKPLLMVFKQLI